VNSVVATLVSLGVGIPTVLAILRATYFAVDPVARRNLKVRELQREWEATPDGAVKDAKQAQLLAEMEALRAQPKPVAHDVEIRDGNIALLLAFACGGVALCAVWIGDPLSTFDPSTSNRAAVFELGILGMLVTAALWAWSRRRAKATLKPTPAASDTDRETNDR
jgi:hypothetical protein